MFEKKYLKWYNKIGYGSGDIAGNVVYAFLSTFMMFYLTDSIGMNMGIVGTLMAISKLFDGFTDLCFGTLIDKTKSRMGKARPWMIFSYIGVAITLVSIFAVPKNWGTNAQYAYFFITYTLLNAVFYTANNIAYASLTALVTKNASERVELGSIRFIFAFATSMLIQAATIQAVDCFGGGTDGWKKIAVIYALIGLVTNTISGLSVKELPVDDPNEDSNANLQTRNENYSLIEGSKLLFSNKYYIMVCVIYILTQLCQSTLNMGIYFMKYILGNAELLSSFSLAMNIPLICGLMICPMLINRIRGMYKLNVVGYAIAVIGRLGVMISAYIGSIPSMLLFTGIAALGTSPLQCDLNALIASCSEYTFLTTGKRIDGTMYSCSSFGIKVGGGIGTAISGWLMASAGFVEKAAIQLPSTINMLHFLYLWAPIILNLAITLVLTCLTVEKTNEMILAERTRFEKRPL